MSGLRPARLLAALVLALVLALLVLALVLALLLLALVLALLLLALVLALLLLELALLACLPATPVHALAMSLRMRAMSGGSRRGLPGVRPNLRATAD